MKQAILIFTALLMSSSLVAQTYVAVLGDYFKASAKDVDDVDLDGWGAGINLSHWFDNEMYVNVAGGVNRSSFNECLQGICVKSDSDVTETNVAWGMRFENITPFVRAGYAKVDSTYTIAGSTFADDETDWDLGIGGLLEVGDVIYGLSADGLRDTDDGFTVTGELTYKLSSSTGISFKLGRLFNVDDLESTRFGIGWVWFF